MLEIFIPTELPGILFLQIIDSDFLPRVKKYFPMTVVPFESKFFRGLHMRVNDESQDIVTLCNGTFGTEYFIDYNWENTKIVSLGSRFFQPETIDKSLNSIISNFDAVIKSLNSDVLLTNTKKEESIKKIKFSFFLLSGVVFNLRELRRKVLENIGELEIIAHDTEQKIEYQGQGTLLKEPLRTKEIELTASIEVLEQKVALFTQATKHLITD